METGNLFGAHGMGSVDRRRDILRPKILIVEDHAQVRRSIRDYLEMNFPYALFVEAADGREAVELAKSELPDVVLMDISLPIMDGIQATREIKSVLPNVLVVMLTIHEDIDYIDDAMDAGATVYLVKRKMALELVPIVARLMLSPR